MLITLCAAVAFAAGAEPIAVRWLADANPPAVEVGGLPADVLQSAVARGGELLAVFAEQGNASVVPAMTGKWQVRKGRLRFEPQFPLARGVRYRAEVRPPGGAAILSYFEMPADTTPASTTVRQVYPSGDRLPENQLKFYVHFSAPMSRGGAHEHVRIRDAAGEIIDLPFLELDEELWDPSMTRLTLLIDPGRIKRGVKPLEDIGPVFEAGKSYRLTIGTTCRDAEGRPLSAAFEKRFTVGPADRSPPDPKRWRIRPPAANTREAVVVDFDEPMEHALALRLIQIMGKAGRPIPGEAALTERERRWVFTPREPWVRGPHELSVASTIEDLAGNNIGKTFDVDVFEGGPRQLESSRVKVGFEIR